MSPHVHLVHNAIENEMVELKIKEALESITKKINSIALFKFFFNESNKFHILL